MLDVQYSLTPFEQLSEAQVLDMLTKKTAALLEYAAWCGAKIGLASAGNVASDLPDRLGQFAALCGTAFQLHDDVLGLKADEATLGKPVGSDLREGKRTLLVYRALANATSEQRTDILGVLGNSAATGEEISRAVAAIEATGACEDVRHLANEHIRNALAILDSLPPSPHLKLLRSWAGFLLARQH